MTYLDASSISRVGFRTLIEPAETTTTIDLRRVFGTAFSNFGIKVFYLSWGGEESQAEDLVWWHSSYSTLACNVIHKSNYSNMSYAWAPASYLLTVRNMPNGYGILVLVPLVIEE